MNISIFTGQVGSKGANVYTPPGKNYSIVTFQIRYRNVFPSGKSFTEIRDVKWFGKEAVKAMDTWLVAGAWVSVAGPCSLREPEGGKPVIQIDAKIVEQIELNGDTEEVSRPARSTASRPASSAPSAPELPMSTNAASGDEDDVPF